ncbi:MAG: tripartite tricarboxylate transporter TctB family protein [Spirochaetales bacterium]|jgi:hypothetical protein|nr:tripartite tricarboxylate transporter TctB family protein [Spirochaetales bacterium]
MSLRKDQDIILGFVILIVSGILWYQVDAIEGAPAIMPRIFISMISISGAGIIIRAIRCMIKTGKPYQKMNLREFLWEAGIPGGVLLMTCLFLEVLGFYICSFILIIAVCILQNIIINKKLTLTIRAFFKIVLFALCVTGFMFFCFWILLSMPTPTGFLGI